MITIALNDNQSRFPVLFLLQVLRLLKILPIYYMGRKDAAHTGKDPGLRKQPKKACMRGIFFVFRS